MFQVDFSASSPIPLDHVEKKCDHKFEAQSGHMYVDEEHGAKMLKFAANISTLFSEWDFLDRFKAAADAGFSAVEFLYPYDYSAPAIAKALDGNGLELALFNIPPGDRAKGERGLAALPGRLDELIRGISLALEYASVTKLKRLHLMAGIAQTSSIEAQVAYERAVCVAAELLNPHGIDVLLEPQNRRDAPGYFLNSFSVAEELITRLNLPNVKLQFDIYHRQILHGDVIKGLRSLYPIIGHVQIASVPDRHEPGTGELDDARILHELNLLGYEGFVGCEYHPLANTNDGLKWRSRI